MTEDDWADLPGRLVVLSGPSGSGKSTLARRLLARPEPARETSRFRRRLARRGPASNPAAITFF